LGLALVRVASWDSKLYCSWKGVWKKGLVGEEWAKKSCLGGEDDTSLQCVLELELGTWSFGVVGKVCEKALGIRSQGRKGLIGWGGISIFAMILRVGNWNLKLWCNWKGVQKMPCGRGAGDREVVWLGGLYIFPMFWLWFSCKSSETTFDYEWCELLVLVLVQQ
jgi:hypothetical protein